MWVPHIRRPLHWAALEGCEECCRLLASAGAVIVAQDDYGQTALHLACLRSHFDVALQLLEYGARIGIKDKARALAPWQPGQEGGLGKARALAAGRAFFLLSRSGRAKLQKP